MKKLGMKDFLPDFYNILLEFHKDDPKGYDILVNLKFVISSMLTQLIKEITQAD